MKKALGYLILAVLIVATIMIVATFFYHTAKIEVINETPQKIYVAINKNCNYVYDRYTFIVRWIGKEKPNKVILFARDYLIDTVEKEIYIDSNDHYLWYLYYTYDQTNTQIMKSGLINELQIFAEPENDTENKKLCF